MQNEQRWSENVMMYDGLSSRKMIELDDLGNRKMMKSRNRGLYKLAGRKLDEQNVECRQLDGSMYERPDGCGVNWWPMTGGMGSQNNSYR